MQHDDIVSAELEWYTENGKVTYTLSGVQRDGQWRLLGVRERDPFGTALEDAQWAVSRLTKVLPPSAW